MNNPLMKMNQMEIEEKVIKNQQKTIDIYGIVCDVIKLPRLFQEKDFQINVKIIGFDSNHEICLFKLRMNEEKQLKKNDLIFVNDCKILTNFKQQVNLKYQKHISQIFIGEIEILQNKGIEFCQKICDELQEYRRMFMLLNIIDQIDFNRFIHRLRNQRGLNRNRRRELIKNPVRRQNLQ